MKFLLIVLAVHFVAEMISSARKNKRKPNDRLMNPDVRHPAEFELRTDE